jgi:hypothetical protein
MNPPQNTFSSQWAPEPPGIPNLSDFPENFWQASRLWVADPFFKKIGLYDAIYEFARQTKQTIEDIKKEFNKES